MATINRSSAPVLTPRMKGVWAGLWPGSCLSTMSEHFC